MQQQREFLQNDSTKLLQESTSAQMRLVTKGLNGLLVNHFELPPLQSDSTDLQQLIDAFSDRIKADAVNS